MALARKEQIRGLQIAMNDARVVSVFQSRRDLSPNVDDLFPRALSAVLDPLLQRAPVDEFHRIITLPVLCAATVVFHDVGVLKPLQNTDLAFKPLAHLHVAHKAGRQHFYRHLFPGLRVDGRIDNAHSAHADLAVQLKRAYRAGSHNESG